MDNLTENKQKTEITPAAEGEAPQQDLGKFKDVQALLTAYSNLEAEFTRRSQRLKELEEKSKAAPPADTDGAPSSGGIQENDLYSLAAQNQKVKERIIGDYVKSLYTGKGAPMAVGGVVVSAARPAPKSIREAGKLAAQFLKGSK